MSIFFLRLYILNYWSKVVLLLINFTHDILLRNFLYLLILFVFWCLKLLSNSYFPCLRKTFFRRYFQIITNSNNLVCFIDFKFFNFVYFLLHWFIARWGFYFIFGSLLHLKKSINLSSWCLFLGIDLELSDFRHYKWLILSISYLKLQCFH